LKQAVWILGSLLAAIAAYTDWRWRRIPNWLTIPSVVLGILTNSLASGWPGAKQALLGLLLGLGLLLPLVLIRSMGAGDWKLAGAVGAFYGPGQLLIILLWGAILGGVMALILIVWRRRLGQTLRNMFHILASLFSFHLPSSDVTLDNPDAVKIPFGIAIAMAVVLYSAGHSWGFHQ